MPIFPLLVFPSRASLDMLWKIGLCVPKCLALQGRVTVAATLSPTSVHTHASPDTPEECRSCPLSCESSKALSSHLGENQSSLWSSLVLLLFPSVPTPLRLSITAMQTPFQCTSGLPCFGASELTISSALFSLSLPSTHLYVFLSVFKHHLLPYTCSTYFN